MLHAHDAAGNDLGFVQATLNSYGEYGLTTDPTAALAFSAAVPADGTAFDMTAQNPNLPAFSLVGAMVGFASSSSDLGSGNPNYLFLTGMSSSSASHGSRPPVCSC